jgi:hypothetical protein
VRAISSQLHRKHTHIIAMQDDVDHQKKADYIAQTILDLMDKDKDGKITLAEFTKFGYKGLPSFDNIGAEGHHYDVESGTFYSYKPFVLSLIVVPVPRIFPPSRR